MSSATITEFESKFFFVDKDDFRQKLNALNARLVEPERLMRRAIYDSSEVSKINGTYARVRDEGDKITMSIKTQGVHGNLAMADQKEICLVIDNFDMGKMFLDNMNLHLKGYHEYYRETWELEGAEIVIDTWPALQSYIEIESHSEERVWDLARKLGVDGLQTTFAGVAYVYHTVYGVSEKLVNDETPVITFNEVPEWARVS
jgi:adenylate cyclase class 2